MREMKDSGIDWIGEIPNNWSLKRIKHLFYVLSGATPSSDEDNWDGDVIWITPADYKTNEKYVSQGKRNLSSTGYANCSTLLVPVGSLIFSKRAPIGTVAISAVPLCTNQGCLSCVKKGIDIDTTYYYYVLSVGTEHFELMGSGTTFREISASAFANCVIPFPIVDEQHRIADFLNAKCAEIDKLIADIQAQIDTLEQYKRSVITVAVTKGLSPDTEMQESGIAWVGTVPAKWNLSKIKYEIFPLQRPVSSDDMVMTCFRDGEVTLRQNRREDGFTVSFTENGYQGVEKGDLVIHGMDAFAGSIGCADSKGKITPVVHVCKTTGNNRFFMYVLRSMAFNDVLMSYSEGIRVRSSDFRNFYKLGKFPIVVPPVDEQNAISCYLDEKSSKIDVIIRQEKERIEVLENYKKSLVFEYITGKKEVQAT